GLLGLELEGKAAHEIARRARGTPRIANRLLRRVRDFASVRDGDARRVKLDTTRFALGRLGVDEAGFDGLDRSFLLTLVEKFGGGPVGLETLAAAVGEDKGTLEDVVEPYLIHCGFLTRTPRGRVATPHAYAHLGVPAAPGSASR
ncbi:MAG: Holliday junction DNA helicase RuvB C-terminal domain-containing protein, partial [Myxococcales bacterium]